MSGERDGGDPVVGEGGMVAVGARNEGRGMGGGHSGGKANWHVRGGEQGHERGTSTAGRGGVQRVAGSKAVGVAF